MRSMEINFNEIAREIFEGNKRRGFTENEIGTDLMLIVSELGEALEADRKSKYADAQSYRLAGDTFIKENFECFIKDTLEDEIADAIIRLLDFVGRRGIDIDFHITEKLKYNETRAFKHGKNY